MSSPSGRVSRKNALVVVGVALTGASALASLTLLPVDHVVTLDRTSIPADGRSTVRAFATSVSVLGTRVPFGDVVVRIDERDANRLGVATMRDHEGALVVRAGTRPGALSVRTDAAHVARVLIRPDSTDADEDGFPDVAELLTEEDRSSFTSWFTAIAESQSRRTDDAWAMVHRDCAGLVRYAYKEALRTHDDTWRRARAVPPMTGASDVAQMRFPELPLLGDAPFRTASGRFNTSKSIESTFSASANARTLKDHNSSFVSRALADARPGDLLFFQSVGDVDIGLHSMVVLGALPGASHKADARRVVYHTGTAPGEVRLVTLDALSAHPDPSWHPRPENPRFLGVHRLHILTHDNVRAPLAQLESR